MVDPRIVSRIYLRAFSGHISFSSFDFFHHATGIGRCDVGGGNTLKDGMWAFVLPKEQAI
jgi:hypothetical protein